MTMNTKKLSTPSSWVKAIAETLAEQGVDASAVLDDLGMDYHLLNDKDARYWQDDITRLWHRSVELTDDSLIGLKVGAHIHMTSYPTIGYSLMSCKNLLESCERLFRYQQLLAEGFHFSFLKEGEEYCLSFDILPCQLAPSIQAIDATIASFLTFVRWVTGQRILPLRASLKRDRPPVLVDYEAIFSCPIKFEDSKNSLYFSVADMALLLPTADETISKIHDANANRYLEQLIGGEFSTKVRHILIECLPSGEPKQEQVALALNISNSTLKRRLLTENTSFKVLLDHTREQLAVAYLENRELTLTEITYLLGFSESSAFNRAFKRWKGVSPKQWQKS